MRRQAITEKGNAYIVLIIANIIFFGLFSYAIHWEMGLPNLQYSAFGFLMFPAVLIYVLIYGPVSYKITKQIILPNILLLLFTFMLFAWVYFFCNPGEFETFERIWKCFIGCVILSGIYTMISVVCSVVTMLISKKRDEQARIVRTSQKSR